MLIDSHCHIDRLDLKKYDGDLTSALRYATSLGVTRFLCPAVVLDSSDLLFKLAKQYKEIDLGIGIHPTEKLDYHLKDEDLCTLAAHHAVVGIGETGLDYYYCENEDQRAHQRRRFATHIRVAREVNKPLIVHSRAAACDIIATLHSEKAETVGGVMHCFTDDWATAIAVMKLNFYISFSGIVTFKNAEALRQIAKRMPLDRILVETDAPYLAPEPHRGQQNEPAFLRDTAEYLAKLLDMPYEKLAAITTENYLRLFGRRESKA
jgi:TatD DNase family protein